jgi:8-oxo-dGTP pyrophosphatase MutT (NUDIX family)
MDNPFEFEDGETASDVPIRPKDAAALILYRRDGATIRILMGERHRDQVFYPGWLVFPGGRVDACDRRLAVATDYRPDVAARLMKFGARAIRGLGLAAIREMFEETGLLVGRGTTTPLRTGSGAWARFFAHGVVPRLEALEFVARAVTPPRRPRRYDTRFFLADASEIAPTGTVPAPSGELLTPRWVTPAEARAARTLRITRRVLDEVEARLAEGSGPARPVPFYMLRRNRPVVVAL